MILSHLSLKTYNLNRSIFCYERYLNIIRKNVSDESIVKSGEKILDGLKTIAEEIKKKQGLVKNKEDTKKIFDELCKKYVLPGYWEDLEKPIHKLVLDPKNNDIPFLSLLKNKNN